MMHYEDPEYKKERRLNKKRVLIAMLGGKCCVRGCGYNKYIGALDFHHKDRAAKSFDIANNLTRSIEVLKAEAIKCMLLCANCHREKHAKDSIGGRPGKKGCIDGVISRKRAGLTNQQIADELGISRQTVNRQLMRHMDPDEYNSHKRRCGCPSAH